MSVFNTARGLAAKGALWMVHVGVARTIEYQAKALCSRSSCSLAVKD